MLSLLDLILKSCEFCTVNTVVAVRRLDESGRI